MKTVLALVLNAALLAILLPWLRRQWDWAGRGWWRAALLLGLGLRALVGVASGWRLKHDAGFMSTIAHVVTAQVWERPAVAWRTLTGAVAVFHIVTFNDAYNTAYQRLSNTWFLIKVLVLCNLASLESSWLNGLYLSLFAFVGCWQFVRALASAFPRASPSAGVVAFLLWPSVWFWAAGISKEALLLGSGAWLTARLVEWLYGGADRTPASARQQIGWWLGTIALALLHFQMRYFFALPLLGVLAGLALARGLERHGLVRQRWAQAAVLVGVLGTGVWVAPKLSVAFRANKFTNQVSRVYAYEVHYSEGRPHFEYPNLRPTMESMAAHAPQAAANVLTRPWLGESREPFLVGAGLENLLLLALLALAIASLIRGRAGHLPFALGVGLGIFCGVLAVLIGLTTPNFGSLNRYRSELLPFFLLLVLQNDYAAALLPRLVLGRPRQPVLRPPESPAAPEA